MRRPWGLIAIVLMLPLGGCFAEQEQQLASCKLEAMRLYPNENPAAFPSGKIGDYIDTCMGAHGYKFSLGPSSCKPHGYAFEIDPHCYVPTSWVGWLIYRLETGG